MLVDRFAHRTEDDAQFCQFFFECGGDGDAVDDRIHSHAGQALLFVQGDAQFLEGLAQFRIDLVEAVRCDLLLRGGVIDDVLEIDRREGHIRPFRLLHRLPVAECLQAPFQQPLRFVLFCGDESYDVFVQSLRRVIRFDVGDEAVFVFGAGHLLEYVVIFFWHGTVLQFGVQRWLNVPA